MALSKSIILGIENAFFVPQKTIAMIPTRKTLQIGSDIIELKHME